MPKSHHHAVRGRWRTIFLPVHATSLVSNVFTRAHTDIGLYAFATIDVKPKQETIIVAIFFKSIYNTNDIRFAAIARDLRDVKRKT